MAGNKDKIDRIHDLLPKSFGSKINPNWKALVEAIGEGDDRSSELIEEVRKQFFVRTASRPYIDRLAANSKISRPKFVGMDDETFKDYIPVLAYQPRQVKAIIDKLLDVFYFKESTTSFTSTTIAGPFVLQDSWTLDYQVDQYKDETIKFLEGNFTDIASATATEVVAAINKQAKYSFATVYYNSITKSEFVKVFTKTIGSKGAITMKGGLANIGLKFEGYLEGAGDAGIEIYWDVTKVGDLVTFTKSWGEEDPNISSVQVGDYVLIQCPGNSGSFEVEAVNLNDKSFSFRNLFAEANTFSHFAEQDQFIYFSRPVKSQVFKQDLRALAWEVVPGQITVEMPASPPAVRRKLTGAAHLNGTVTFMASKVDATTLVLEDASEFPESGSFLLQPKNQIIKRIKTTEEDVIETEEYYGRLEGFSSTYTYTGKSEDTLTGISPDLPELADLNEYSLAANCHRDSNNTVTIFTTTPHDFQVDDTVVVADTVYDEETPTPYYDDPIALMVSLDGIWKVIEVGDSYFKYRSVGDVGVAEGGTARIERPGLAPSGSKIYLKSARTNTGMLGPYVWDPNAAFVLSSLTADINSSIRAGNIVRTLEISDNEIPAEEGMLIFDYGNVHQEGPVRYLYKASDNTLALDPVYVFKFNHSIGSSVTLIRKRGPHTMSSSAQEYPFYVTDPAVAREILQDLIREVKSVGIFIEFLVRYPPQLYGCLDVYRSGVDES